MGHSHNIHDIHPKRVPGRCYTGFQKKYERYDLELRQMEVKVIDREETSTREAAERKDRRQSEAVGGGTIF